MEIRGNTQIKAGTVTADRFVTNLGLATSQLAEGTEFLKRGGTVAYTGNQDAGGFQIANLGTPTADNHAATKGYVDAARMGLSVKDPVRVATTGNITLSGTQTIDGVALSVGDRVLVRAQTDATQNGIYIVASGGWTRSADADNSAEVKAGLAVWVNEGTANGDSRFVLTTNDTITLGTTALTFTKDSGGTSVSAGAGLVQNGSAFDITNTDNSILVGTDDISVRRDTGGAIGVTATGLRVNVDGTTLEISGNNLRLAAGAAGDGLTVGTGNILNINVSATGGLGITSDALGIKLDGGSLALTSAGLKIADPGAGKVIMGNSSGLATATTITGDATLSAAGALTLAANILREADYVGQPETLTGTPNGTLTAFTLSVTPVTGTASIYINGLLQRPTTDYSISGNTVTFVSAPQTGDWISAIYLK